VIGEGELLAGRYRLVSQISTGAMGVVWKARDERLQRIVTVKQLLHVDMSAAEAEQAKRRALREGRITARLHHPHAITVYNVAEHEGEPYLIMEYMPSESLSTVLAERGPLPPAEVARIGSQVAAALAAAHEVGIVHRDIQPGNVLLADDGTAKITDFGVSDAVGDGTVTATAILSGTPAYLAPEVARGKKAGFPADVFSLGSTLYAAVEGIPPFGLDDNALALLFRIANSEIIPPRKAGSLTPVLAQLLERDLSRRPTMQQAQEALATVLPALAVPLAPGTPVTVSLPPTADLPPSPDPGPSLIAAPFPSTGAFPEHVTPAGDVLSIWPPTDGVKRPPRPAAAAIVATVSLLVVGFMVMVALINDGNSITGPRAGPPTTTPGTAQNQNVLQPPPTVDNPPGAAPILALNPEFGRGPSPVPSPTISLEPSPTTDPEPSPTASPEPSPTTIPEPSLTTDPEPSPTTDPEPSPTIDPEPSPTIDPEPSPTTDPEPSPTTDPEPSLEPSPEAGADR
jgi:eukaryotic-like serine/threonine-protein kinase